MMVCAAAVFAAGPNGKLTPLDKYIQAPDSNYRYELVKTFPGSGYTGYLIEMTSCAWRTPVVVDRPIWKHWLTIIKPEKVEGNTGFLSITGGHIPDPPPRMNPNWVDCALTTHTVVAEVFDVPNEPVKFAGYDKSLSEDAIVAYTWVQFLKTGDETWPLHFTMAKAAIRAMDTVTAFCAGQHVKVEKFVTSGGSKRGWTTWLTAAADPRVVAIIPKAIDLLNNEKSYQHQYQAYGAYSPAIKAYEQAGITDVYDQPRYQELLRLEDPYSYRERFTMPKFLINAAGDQFFTPDSSRFYFDDLPGEKYLRYLPNTDHSLGLDSRESLIAFYDAFLHHRPRPQFTWRFEENGDIRVQCKDKPSEVLLWQATNPKARDFRVMSIGRPYKSAKLTELGAGTYVAKIEKPAKGWTASFVELTFPSASKYPFKFTTAVRITPDTLPFELPKPTGKLRE
jgi:PhoPQ-activated pathogenicity-related protein